MTKLENCVKDKQVAQMQTWKELGAMMTCMEEIVKEYCYPMFMHVFMMYLVALIALEIGLALHLGNIVVIGFIIGGLFIGAEISSLKGHYNLKFGIVVIAMAIIISKHNPPVWFT